MLGQRPDPADCEQNVFKKEKETVANELLSIGKRQREENKAEIKQATQLKQTLKATVRRIWNLIVTSRAYFDRGRTPDRTEREERRVRIYGDNSRASTSNTTEYGVTEVDNHPTRWQHRSVFWNPPFDNGFYHCI